MFHDFITIFCLECNHTVKVPVYCGNRFCPICSKIRLLRVRHRIEFLLKGISFPPGTRLKHLTLTIPNQPDLPTMLKKLTSSFRKLRHTAWWKNHVIGGCFVLEVTGTEGNWHGHIHSIISAYYLKWETLRNLWIRFSGGRGVWISVIPRNEAIRYLSKYLTKPDLPDATLKLVSGALKGYRLFQPYGSWYGISNMYHRPLAKCSKCGAVKSFELYALYYGGWIRNYEDIDEIYGNAEKHTPVTTYIDFTETSAAVAS